MATNKAQEYLIPPGLTQLPKLVVIKQDWSATAALGEPICKVIGELQHNTKLHV
jgi:hypothetical protein